jgi:hypothetical protein
VTNWKFMVTTGQVLWVQGVRAKRMSTMKLNAVQVGGGGFVSQAATLSQAAIVRESFESHHGPAVFHRYGEAALLQVRRRSVDEHRIREVALL